jgi:hypothetical protein
MLLSGIVKAVAVTIIITISRLFQIVDANARCAARRLLLALTSMPAVSVCFEVKKRTLFRASQNVR